MDQTGSEAARVHLEDPVGDPGHDKKELELAGGEPSPVETSFVRDDVAGNEIDRHREHGPPILTAIREAFFISEPARAICKVRSNLPPNEKHEVVDRSKTQVPQRKHLQVLHDCHLLVALGFFHKVSYF